MPAMTMSTITTTSSSTTVCPETRRFTGSLPNRRVAGHEVERGVGHGLVREAHHDELLGAGHDLLGVVLDAAAVAGAPHLGAHVLGLAAHDHATHGGAAVCLDLVGDGEAARLDARQRV